MLIIVCSRALGLATAISMMSEHGVGASAGVLIPQCRSLRGTRNLIVDKTGTLTEGKPRLMTVEAWNGQDEVEILRMAASLEQASERPLASAIVVGAREHR